MHVSETKEFPEECYDFVCVMMCYDYDCLCVCVCVCVDRGQWMMLCTMFNLILIY